MGVRGRGKRSIPRLESQGMRLIDQVYIKWFGFAFYYTMLDLFFPPGKDIFEKCMYDIISCFGILIQKTAEIFDNQRVPICI